MTEAGQPLRQLRLDFSGSRPQVLSQIMPHVRAIGAFLRDAGCAADPAQKLSMVAEEMLTNIAQHAWTGAQVGRGSVQVEAIPHDESIEVTLRTEDDGAPFDPTRATEPDLDAPLEERALGGLGILMIRRMTDRQIWRRIAGSNVFEVAKRCARAQPCG